MPFFVAQSTITLLLLFASCNLLLLFYFIAFTGTPDNDIPQPFFAEVPSFREDTLGVFSHIFVVSRPARIDRRTSMEQLRLALGIKWQYVDAVSSDGPLVDEISHCLHSFRRLSHLSTFQWPSDSVLDQLVPSSSTSSSTGSAISGIPKFCNLFRDRTGMLSSHFSNHSASVELLSITPSLTGDPPNPLVPLTCATRDNIHGVDFVQTLPVYMLLTAPKLACWYSHLVTITRFTELHESILSSISRDKRRANAALVLEDDIDMEWDIRHRLQGIWDALPVDWDIVFLGHCWSNESHFPALHVVRPLGQFIHHSETALHPAFAPKCTHAYALSTAGARRLLSHLLYPPFAYSRALDQAFAWLVRTNRLRAYSIVPSLVIQRKSSSSDIDGGENGLGSNWREQLYHSVLG